MLEAQLTHMANELVPQARGQRCLTEYTNTLLKDLDKKWFVIINNEGQEPVYEFIGLHNTYRRTFTSEKECKEVCDLYRAEVERFNRG